MANSGIDADTRRKLALGSKAGAGDGSIHHAAREFESAVVQIAPQTPYLLVREVRSLVQDHRIRATGRGYSANLGSAVAGPCQSGFEEGLRCNRTTGPCAPAASQTSDASAILQHNI